MYIDTITLAAPRGTATQAGIAEVTAAEIRFDLLDAEGQRTNPSAVTVATRSITTPPQPDTPWSDLRALIAADIEASLPLDTP